MSIILCTTILKEYTSTLFRKSSSSSRTNEDTKLVSDSNSLLPQEKNIIEELYEYCSPERLSKIAEEHKGAYASATPFPHTVIDGIFPMRFLRAVLEENPESNVINGCVRGAGACFRDPNQNKKSAIMSENYMGMYTKILFAVMKSSSFVTFLEQLSGIKNIIPDPHYRGSGLHFTVTGGNLNIHADFNTYRDYNLDRRLNIFIFLNPDWPEEHGGHLELWSRDMKSCHERVLPTLGRFVAFSSTDFSYHGHPAPLAAPSGRARRSMALYYYTNGRPSDECLEGVCSGTGHSTLFQKPVGCEKCEEDTCKRFDELIVPNWIEK